jgi:Xaa-Pro dipeptidase
MHFPRDEYDQRIHRTRKAMEAAGFDLLLLFGQEAMAWTSGYYTPAHFGLCAFALPRDGEPFLVVRGIEKPGALVTTWVDGSHILPYTEDADPMAELVRAVVAHGFGRARIGVDAHAWYLTAERYLALVEGLPDAVIKPEGRMIDALRFRKSEAEISALHEAALIVQAGLQGAIDATREGVSEREIAAAMAAARIRAGSDLPIDGVLTTGERTTQSHGPWTDRKVKRGDPLKYEFHGIHKNYWARMMRSGAVGEPSAEQRKVFDLLVAAQNAGLKAMKAGVSSRVVDSLHTTPLIESGYRDCATYKTKMGYGLGLNFRPSPGEFLLQFMRDTEFTLEAGMVFHMIITLNGVGISDTVVVRDEGVEFITRYPRQLFTC